MKSAFFLSFIFCWALYGANVVPGDEYRLLKEKKVEMVVASEYEEVAKEVVDFEEALLNVYQKSYGYRLDRPLYLGLASSHNQISNAFSTQMPLNMQMNYIGGSLLPDYFATTSWLKTILIHESAHNFQLNARANPLSDFAHKIVKNSPFTTFLFVPIFPLPNLLESPFMLEGNAVLNESLFGNGGRLYSGAALALAITQAKAGYITPKRSYNEHLFFPYTTHHYLVGGFFSLYLAQKYGIEKTNRYFLDFSRQWLPLFTNHVFKESFGESFEEALSGYNRWLLEKAQVFTPSEGERIAFSKNYVDLSKVDDTIAFLTSDALNAPTLWQYSCKSGEVIKRKTHHLFGKLFKEKGRYYTLASSKTSSKEITIGLFDERGEFKEGSGSKAFQSILSNRPPLYFDVVNSYDGFQLYEGEHFIDTVNSSAFRDRAGNIYYFKQNGKERTLFKNKKPLLRFLGWYAKVVDIDSKGRVLFISNSQTGTTLYRFSKDGVERLCRGDDILDAKLINENELLLEVIRADGIAFIKEKISPQKAEVFEVCYFFEDRYHLDLQKSKQHSFQKYQPLANLHYSALSQSFEYTDQNEFNFNISVLFSDPLLQNSLSLYLYKYDDTIGGIRYDNSAYLLGFGVDLYGVLEREESTGDVRDFGLNLYLNYPWYQKSYESGNLVLNYHLDDDKEAKSPLSMTFSFSHKEQYGHSFYPNYLQSLSLFGLKDRGDFAYGGAYTFCHVLGENQFYVGAKLHYAKSDAEEISRESQRGVVIDYSEFSSFYDPSRFVMPSLEHELYTDEAFKVEFSAKKVFDFSKYFFSFPFSLRRESLYANYRLFELKSVDDRWVPFNEYSAGVTFEFLGFHQMPFPLSVEYLYNDNLKEQTHFRVLFDIAF